MNCMICKGTGEVVRGIKHATRRLCDDGAFAEVMNGVTVHIDACPICTRRAEAEWQGLIDGIKVAAE